MAHNEPQRKEALHQTHHNYYLNISVETANLSDWRIESNRKNRFGSENRIESNQNIFARIGMLYPVFQREHEEVSLSFISISASIR